MPEICPRYARDMPKICPRYARDMPEICPRYARDMPKICPAQDMTTRKTVLTKHLPDKTSKPVLTKCLPDKTSADRQRALYPGLDQYAKSYKICKICKNKKMVVSDIWRAAVFFPPPTLSMQYATSYKICNISGV